MIQRLANKRPNVIPACYEKRRWAENMIAVTNWVDRGRAIISVPNTTAIVHHFIHTAVSNYFQTLFINRIKKFYLYTVSCTQQPILVIVHGYL